ncbi:MAG: hypothetical protein JKY55_15420 [Aliivibrio sp.]|uniref:hypothetical protein n=1 Tax=Aliivibrio sp. TaxID=1872443 RepID=UPI001A45A3A0|nr:hypothetical protein [Aliivibrio sp.]
MNTLEIYSKINETLDILIWPLVIVIIIISFQKTIATLLARAAGIEGKVGDISFKVSLQEMMQEKVTEAVKLKEEGKDSEAQIIIDSASQVVATLYGLSKDDIEELILLSLGEHPKRKWGKTHLVRAGLVELNGGKITNQGKILVSKYLNT